MRRRHGTGSVTHVTGKDLWRASIELPSDDGKRRRWAVTNRDRDVVVGMLDAKLREMGIEPNPPERKTRAEYLRDARARGTHTRTELRALHRSTPPTCRYCGVRMNVLNQVVDHATSIARGGSDAIANLQVICWECNAEKGDTAAADFHYHGPQPRPFRVLPSRAHRFQFIPREAT